MDFSYKGYVDLIEYIGKYLPIVTFKQSIAMEKFCVIRHDVEYSPQRAYQLAKVEHSIGVTSTFCFQLRNNSYNALSKQNLEIIRDISNMGHIIGAHIHTDDCEPGYETPYILNDIQTLQRYANVPVDGWSLHRPKGDLLAKYLEVHSDYINYNGKRFFQYHEGNTPDNLPVTYLADSNHQWKYGHPYDFDLSKIDKLQINCHPFSWSEYNLNNTENFTILTQEKKLEVVNSINNEIKNYPKELYEKEKRDILDRC